MDFLETDIEAVIGAPFELNPHAFVIRYGTPHVASLPKISRK
jgi:hypothetical protein